MSDPIQVAQNFIKFYNDTFNQNRAALANLYQENSFMSFEGQACQGPVAIAEKLQVPVFFINPSYSTSLLSPHFFF